MSNLVRLSNIEISPDEHITSVYKYGYVDFNLVFLGKQEGTNPYSSFIKNG